MNLSMAGRLEECVLLDYRVPACAVRGIPPPGIEPVMREGWSFWNVVVCRIAALRPAGAPRAFGVDTVQVGYRLRARARLDARQRIEGLWFARTDVDRAAVGLLGNLASDFRMRRAWIDLRSDGGSVSLRVRDRRRGLETARLRAQEAERAELAPGSPFRSIEEACSFLRYTPVALSRPPSRGGLRVAQVRREEALWNESPLRVIEAQWSALERLGQQEITLERAVRISPLNYLWHLNVRIRSQDKLLQIC
jgi:hypothetical protein